MSPDSGIGIPVLLDSYRKRSSAWGGLRDPRVVFVAVGSPRAHYRVTFAVLSLGVAAFALLQSLVIPVLTTVQHQLHTTQDTVTWVLTAYLLSASIMTPILGRIGDMIGKERVFVATLGRRSPVTRSGSR